MAYMQRALKGVPEQPMEAPDGVVSLRINAESGLRDDGGGISEWFFSEYVPRRDDTASTAPGAPSGPPRDVRTQLF
jgi:penicillin-binding protein 1A